MAADLSVVFTGIRFENPFLLASAPPTESDVNILDIAALAVIVREAGGRFTDLSGGELTLDTTTVLASNGSPLHDLVGETVGFSYRGG